MTLRMHRRADSPQHQLRRIVMAGTLSCVTALAGCRGKDTPDPLPRPVVATPVHGSTLASLSRLPCTIEARNSTSLSFRVSGKIIERRAKLGTRVKPGEVLARLDPSDLATQATSARAQLEGAEAHLSAAAKQLERDHAQAPKQLIARSQLEQTIDAYAAAAAQRDQAQQQLARAQNQLRYADLVADRAGTISAEYAETGQNVAAAQSVYGLVGEDGVDVSCDAPETLVAGLRAGQPATVAALALPDTPLRALVREISPAADPQSRTYRVKLTVDAPPAALRPGMTASVVFSLPKDTAATRASSISYTLPATALFHDGPATALWIVSHPDNVLSLRRVQVSRYDANTIEVISGLQDGETVVLQGVHTVSIGQKVRVIPPLHQEAMQP